MATLLKKKKKCKKGAEEYMTTYGDMMTLLLTFFVMLLSVSSLDVQKFKLVISSFTGALGVLKSGETITQVQQLMNMGLDMNQLSGKHTNFSRKVAQIRKILHTPIQRGQVRIRQDERGLIISITDKTLFKTGSDELIESSKDLLDKIAIILTNIPNQLRIEGHTDNVPIKTDKFESNWELSSSRAITVLQYLKGNYYILGNRMSVAGYGEFRPVVPNDTPDGRALNRRVDIVVLKESVGVLEPK